MTETEVVVKKIYI